MQPEQPDPAMITAARAYALSIWTYDPSDYVSAAHRDTHIDADARGTAQAPWFAAIFNAGRERGLREATEGWEREWGLDLHGRGASCVLSERDARGIAAGCPDHLKAEVFSRLVGPWEPADQLEPVEADRG
jgi:hypothetical protein